MDQSTQVAVVRGDRRRGAVAEALCLITRALKERVGHDPVPVILPDLQNPARAWTCTHADTLSATADALLAAGASALKVVGGQGDPERYPGHPLRRLGYTAELWGRPVQFAGFEPSVERWNPIRWFGPDGMPEAVRVHPQVAASRCRVSLAVARTHGTFRVGLGLANMIGSLHPEDRAAIRLDRGGNGSRPGSHGPARALVESARGKLVDAWMALRSVSGGMRLTSRERRRVADVEESSRRLVALAAFLRPAVSLVDGFSAMQGEGPWHGRQLPLGTIIAGTDAVAVDAVAASVLGFEPMEIGYLREAQALGLGTADLSRIEIVGDPLVRPARRIKRHSADPLLRLAGRTEVRRTPPPRPHFQALGQPQREGSHAHRH